MMADPEFMRHAIRLAEEMMRADRGGPFGAVIVKDGRVIAEGFNKVTSDNDPTAHAEVVAIREACAALGSFTLEGAEIYTSCEPCPMCLGAMLAARLPRVVFGCADPKAGACGSVLDFAAHPGLNHQLEVTGGVCAAEASALLSSFFQDVRARNAPA